MEDDAKSGLMQDLLNESQTDELVEEKEVETEEILSKEIEQDEPEVATITKEFAQKAILEELNKLNVLNN